LPLSRSPAVALARVRTRRRARDGRSFGHERQISRHGLDAHVRTDAGELRDALNRAILTAEPSLVIVDDPAYDASPRGVPVLVVQQSGAPKVILEDHDGLAAEIARRLA
jgi:hypothetical protein